MPNRIDEPRVAVQLPQVLYKRLERVAKSTHLPVERLLEQTLEAGISVRKKTPSIANQEPIVVVIQRMSTAAQRRMNTLMDKNTEGELSEEERAELETLVSEYERIMLANSETLVRRTIKIDSIIS